MKCGARLYLAAAELGEPFDDPLTPAILSVGIPIHGFSREPLMRAAGGFGGFGGEFASYGGKSVWWLGGEPSNGGTRRRRNAGNCVHNKMRGAVIDGEAAVGGCRGEDIRSAINTIGWSRSVQSQSAGKAAGLGDEATPGKRYRAREGTEGGQLPSSVCKNLLVVDCREGK